MNPTQVSDAQAEALEVLWNNGGRIVTPKKVAEEREVSNKAASALLKRMEPELVSIEKSSQGNIIEFTDTGRDIASELFEDAPPYGRGNVQTDVQTGSSEGGKRLHGFTVQARIQNSRSLPDDWMAVLQEREDLNWLKTEENDWIAARDTWVIRFHKDAVTFQLRDGCSIRGTSSSEVLRKAHLKASEISSWIEQVADVDLQERYFINRSELAFEKHPLSELADDLPGIPLSRFQVIDPDLQEQVLKMDASPGFPELEAQSGEQAEKVAQAVEQEMNQYALNPEAVEERHQFERELQAQGVSGQEAVQSIQKATMVEEQLRTTETKVESLEEESSDMKQAIQSNSQLFQELQATREEEKKTRDAFMEQVRAINNLAQSNQKVLQEKIVPALDVVPHQTELIESMASRMEELEEKIRKIAEPEVQGGVSSSEVTTSSRPGQGIEGEEPDEIDDLRPETSEKPELVSIEVSTMAQEEEDPGSSESMFEELPEYAVDPSSLRQGLRFKDLREDLLLEISNFELEETSRGFCDMASIRVAGTLRTWNTMPRNELARLLGTGRFDIVDQDPRGQEEESSEDDDSVIIEEDNSEADSDAHYFY